MANGLIDTRTLTPVRSQPSLRLTATAEASLAVVAAVILAVYGWVLTLTDAYRDYATQERIFRQRYTTTYLPGRPFKVWQGRRWYLKAGYAAAAVPGTSNHGLGITVDVANLGGFNGTRYKQFAAVAEPRGWSNAEGRAINEAWHWNHVGGGAGTVTNPIGGGTATPTVPDLTAPAPPIAPDLSQEDTMILVEHTNGSDLAYYTFTPLAGLKPVPASPINADLGVWKACLPIAKVSGNAGLDPFIRAYEAHGKPLVDRTATTDGTNTLLSKLLEMQNEQGRIGTRLKEIAAAPAYLRQWARTFLKREFSQADVDDRTTQVAAGSTLAAQQYAIQYSPEAAAAAAKK
ncbi:M15 family metallopeptidase [Cellulomonas sp. ACRRI]|uniref:M15 family metallopeptidase n=1 Tax=Cellulomonas sp. ACRRI TaxID=2918188 RepID=UPI001EF29F83|nr:M15 family metallopeptidase [Cellulomonas sp. ACRRI]MCG7284950.1 M15 family metallopeptidase [Cellulomonas sp. ACRRI]